MELHKKYSKYDVHVCELPWQLVWSRNRALLSSLLFNSMTVLSDIWLCVLFYKKSAVLKDLNLCVSKWIFLWQIDDEVNCTWMKKGNNITAVLTWALCQLSSHHDTHRWGCTYAYLTMIQSVTSSKSKNFNLSEDEYLFIKFQRLACWNRWLTMRDVCPQCLSSVIDRSSD